jgi:hypothetical protein
MVARPFRWSATLLAGLLLGALGASSGSTAPGLVRVRTTARVHPTATGSALSSGVYQLLSQRVGENRLASFVYKDQDSALNIGFPSGKFGNKFGVHDPAVVEKVHVETGCIDDPSRPDGCSIDLNRLDTVRGTVFSLRFDPLAAGEDAGLHFEEPKGRVGGPIGVGYDLTGATHISFDIRSPSLNPFSVRFGVNNHNTVFMPVPRSPNYTQMSFSLSDLGVTPAELMNIPFLFTVATNDVNAPQGGILLLDNIRFTPVPVSQQLQLGFPLGTQTFGVVPRLMATMDRVPTPLDQVLRNVTTTYESALTLLTLLSRRTPQDLNDARLLAETFHYALHHPNQGDPLPVAPDGSRGFYNAYMGGNLALLNTQAPPAQGQAGDSRLAGFTCKFNAMGQPIPSEFCLVLDGATGGNNAFAMLALLAAYRQFGDLRYLEDARTIGTWITAQLTDTTNTGFGGYYNGYPDPDPNADPSQPLGPKMLQLGKSVENNADIFAAFMQLAAIERSLGNVAGADIYTARANIAGDFVMAMFDSVAGRFNAGTVPVGTAAQPGITPNGPQLGNDVINTFDFLDANTFTTLALAASSRYRNAIDWRRPVMYAAQTFEETVFAGGLQFSGFNLVANATAGPQGVAWEFTGQMVETMRFVDQLYGQAQFQSSIQLYLNQLRQAQQFAPFTDGRGLVAGTVQNGDLLPHIEQALTTPFQNIPERVGLAASNWAVYADCGFNVLLPASTTVLYPNGGETHVAGTNDAILWDGNGVSGNVKIEYSSNGGVSWLPVYNSTENDGFAIWTVQGPPTSQARIRITSVENPAIFDGSNASFVINPPSITITYPNGGEPHVAGTNDVILWNSSGVTGNVKIEYSTNGGVTWLPIYNSTENDGSAPWTVQGPPTNAARIRITSLNDPAVFDISNGNFIIQ